MSFILDALKKSEAERKRQDAPGIASIPTPTATPSGHRWIWLLAGLLAINLVVLAGIVLKPALMQTDGAPAEPAAASVAPPPVQAPASRAAGPSPDVTPAIATPAAAMPGPAATANATPAETPAPQAAADAGLPTFEELRAAGRLQLPDLHIDIHVYSGQPADRFVFVNMTKYRENMSLAEGPVVSRITPDGVVLDYLGIRFLLPRE